MTTRNVQALTKAEGQHYLNEPIIDVSLGKSVTNSNINNPQGGVR